MTDKPTPTDAQRYLNVASQCAATATSELAKNVLVDGGSGTLRELLNDAADAIRAGWGQPAQETNGRKVFVCTHCDGVYADQPVTRCDCLPDENTFTEGWICFGAPAQAAEPVAWMSPWRKDQVTTDYDAYGKQGIPLYAAPQPVARATASPTQPTQAQPGAVPLTNEQIRAMLNKHPPEAVCDWSYRMGIDDAELHHGIKGGQHG